MRFGFNRKQRRRQAALQARADKVTTPISRRSLLGGLGAGALALSLPAWRPLEAQSTAPVKRFISFFTPNGTVRNRFFPSSGASPTSSTILAPLRPFDSKVNVLKGVHMDSMVGDSKPGGPHMKGPAAMLTGGWLLEGSFSGAGGPAGYANRASVDQVLAGQIGNDTPFPSLEFGVDMRGQEPLKYISYRGANQPNPAVDDPWAVYERIFADFQPGEAAQLAQRNLEQRTVLDYAKGELATLSSRLPSEDRQRLEAHLESVRSIERRIGTFVPSCEPLQLGNKIDVKADDNFPTIGKLQMDLMFLAHTCDLTRVSTFMWSNADSWQRMPWLGIEDEHHGLSHNQDDASIDKLIRINTWYSEQIAYFLELMDGVPEGDGTMLDHGLVLCGNEIGQGRNHTHEDIPWITIGSAAGHLRTGRFMEFGNQPHNNLLLSVLHAFGMEGETSFGAPENCTGPLNDLRA